jgi:fimbrial chaperone protein
MRNADSKRAQEAFRRAVAAIALILALTAPGKAASLRVAPVLLDLPTPQHAASVNVWNDGAAAINVQVRVMRWRQQNGEDILEATDDVVVSPPISQLAPGAENLIRVVRVAKTPVAGEESYRLLVDELPDPASARGGAVALVLRHSIPVFFGLGGSTASVAWHAAPEAGGIRLTADNAGGRRLRVANLKLAHGNRVLASRDGLVGYVLSGQSASWLIPVSGGASGPISVIAESEVGRFDAVAAPGR